MFISKVLPAILLAFAANAGTVDTIENYQASLDNYIASQSAIFLLDVLANIGSDGTKAQGAAPGIVVASPSKSNPDYCYTWIRDSALAYKVIAERFARGDASLRQKLDDYVSAQATLQGVSNLSGGPDTDGLGEPKFNIDKTAFTGAWGRPQRDGPALRATTLIVYANWLIANGNTTQATDTLWPIISKDLAYVVNYWNQTGYDIWEEIIGLSFFTLSASQRALVEGAALATKLSKTCDGCAATAPEILCSMQNFWKGNFINSNINVDIGRTGKDANSLISSIHTFDPTSRCTNTTFQPCSSRALANHKAVTDSFRKVYGINKGVPQGQAVAVGRYSEDVYYNGNPWYVATIAAAEQLYAALYQWDKIGYIDVDSLSLPFFQDVVPTSAVGSYMKDSATYNALSAAVRQYADGYMAILQKYTPSNSGLTEQFNQSTGTPLSAVDLTWSYTAFITAAERRAGTVSPSWGEPENNVPPTSCIAESICNAHVTFNERKSTLYGENIFVVGQLTELGNWDPNNAKPLGAGKYTSSDPLWNVVIDVPADRTFEYKYIKKAADGTVTWESDHNRSFTTPQGCGSNATINDTWQ